METKEIQLFSHKSKSDNYIKNSRIKWEDYYKSQRVIMEKIIKPGMSVLDVGCAAGGLYEVLEGKFGNIRYTGFDLSPAELEVGRKLYPKANFICGNFYEHDFQGETFDLVIGNLIVSHQRDWKKFINRMVCLSRKYIIFDVRLRYDASTITDIDTSYLFYHGSGKRNHMVVFNFYELFNFLNIEQFNLNKITVYGYYAPDKTSGFIPMPKSKMIAAGFGLEKHDNDVKIERKGGRKECSSRPWITYDITLPDFSMNDI